MEERISESRRGPPPPWYREYWWLWPVALLLIVAAIIAFLALRGGGGNEALARQPVSGQNRTVTAASETIEMPDVVGTQYRDAVEQLLDTGLFPDSWPVESRKESGSVVDQRPDAGAPLAPGSTVRIDVSLGSGEPEEHQVPDLTGLSLDDALRACAEAGFTCRTVPAGGAGRVVTAERPVGGELTQIELSTG
jgi:hypothetical protein